MGSLLFLFYILDLGITNDYDNDHVKDNDNGEMNDNDDITVYKFVDDTKALYSIGKGEKLNEFQKK